MTFDEWKEQNLNRFTCSHEVFVAYDAWQQQQTRIDELEELLKAYDIQAYSEGYQDGKKECLFDAREEHDRYELEQAIMSCWSITDDLHLLADAMESGEHKRMHHEMLLNLSQLYELKFQKLFKEFNKFTGCSHEL